MTLAKIAPKKKFCPKNRFFHDLGKFSIGKIVFLLKPFLGALFTKVICTFLKSVQKDGFLCPIRPIKRKKIFYS
jgi:hypothetical protein